MDQGIEERQILVDKFGHIRVTHGPDENHIFWQLRVSSLEIARHDEDGLYRTHTEVIMVILRQLL